MRFALALLATSVSALELPSYFFDDNLTTGAKSWRTDISSPLADVSYLSSRFNNRLRFQPNTGSSGKLNDLRGYNPAGADTVANNSWFGGCYFKPSADFEAYYNDAGSFQRGLKYTDTLANGGVQDGFPDF